MDAPHHFTDTKKQGNWRRVAIGYWLAWALLLAGLAWGIHRYFDWRTRELDRRLEQLK